MYTYLVGAPFTRAHIRHPQSGTPICHSNAWGVNDWSQTDVLEEHILCYVCDLLSRSTKSIEGYSAVGMSIMLCKRANAEYWSLNVKDVEAFLNWKTDPRMEMNFAQAFIIAKADGNMGIYADEVLTTSARAVIRDRRTWNRSKNEKLFVCDGLDASAFRKSCLDMGITDPVEIADQFLREQD